MQSRRSVAVVRGLFVVLSATACVGQVQGEDPASEADGAAAPEPSPVEALPSWRAGERPAPTPVADAGAPADAPRPTAPTPADAGPARAPSAPATPDAGAARPATDAGPATDARAATPDTGPAPAPTAPAPSVPAPAQPAGFLPAFPGAEGFGARATGGRGGAVCAVTTLATGRTPGSLQWCLDQPGPRTIVFRVSGVIDGTVNVTRGDVTIAGQTSPGGVIVRGINLQGDVVCEDEGCPVPSAYPRNFIVRHLRSRPTERVPATGWRDEDGVRLHHAVNGVLDHVSVGNAADEAAQVSFSRDVTIQDSIFAETVGANAPYGGILFQYSDPTRGFPLTNVSFHHNTLARFESRVPALSRENRSASGTVMDVEIASNLVWDPGFYVDPARTQLYTPSSILYYHLNWVNNQAVTRTDFRLGFMNSEAFTGLPAGHLTTTYFSGNEMSRWPGRRDYQLMFCCNTYGDTMGDASALPFPDAARPPAFARATRHAFPAVTYTPTSDVRAYMVRNAGAFPRDPMDRRLLAAVQANRIDPTARGTNPANDSLRQDFTVAPAPPADRDSDGIPDAWEAAHGLNPAVANHAATALSSNTANGVPGCWRGYTDLECYLNELALVRVATGR